MRRLCQFLIVISLALILWKTSFFLSAYFADDFARGQLIRTQSLAVEQGQSQKRVVEQNALSAELQVLFEQSKKNSKDVKIQLEFAQALRVEARANRSPELFSHAISQYEKVLLLEAKNATALQEIAEIYFDIGSYEEAKQYFKKFLELNPDDAKAGVDYSLALLQLGRSADAIEFLETLFVKHRSSFSVGLTLALAYRLSGDREKARATALAASEFIPDETGKKVIESFLTSLDSSSVEKKISPATVVNRYFREHPILSPKIASINWRSSSAVDINLNNFPIARMPEFARNKMIETMKERFGNFEEIIQIRLVDAGSGSELLTVSVGRKN